VSLPRSILCVVDAAMQKTPAARRAVELCRRSGAQLHLLMVAFDLRIDATAELVDPEVSRLARERFIEQRLRWLGEWCSELAEQKLRVSSEVVWARKVHDAVLANVAERSPGLVVKDLHRRDVLKRWSVLSIDDSRLARVCPVPLMLVQADSRAGFARVGAAVDPGHAESRSTGLDDAVVRLAMPMAMLAGASLQLLHVVPHAAGREGLSIEIDELLERLREEDQDAFFGFADRYGVALEQRVLMTGDVVAELLRHVEGAQTDLLVIGSQFRKGLDRFLLGSHGESLVAQVPCDILLVRPEGFLEAAAHADVRDDPAR
jgi:universal stress protein E